MPHFKDKDNNIHFIGDESFKHILPTGCVKITDKEADTLRAANAPKPTKQQQDDIDALKKAKGRTIIKYLVTHTPEEIETFVNNSPDIKAVVSDLAVAVSVLSKDLLRDSEN